jgi:hypothetical protein
MSPAGRCWHHSTEQLTGNGLPSTDVLEKQADRYLSELFAYYYRLQSQQTRAASTLALRENGKQPEVRATLTRRGR